MADKQFEFLIRPARQQDAENIAALKTSRYKINKRQRSRFSLEAFIRDGFSEKPLFMTLVAEIEDSLSGYAIFYWGYDVHSTSRGVYLSDLYVSSNCRRCGIGTQLVKEVCRYTQENAGRWILWSVLKNNKVARRFYHNLAPELKDVKLHGAFDRSFDRIVKI